MLSYTVPPFQFLREEEEEEEEEDVMRPERRQQWPLGKSCANLRRSSRCSLMERLVRDDDDNTNDDDGGGSDAVVVAVAGFLENGPTPVTEGGTPCGANGAPESSSPSPPPLILVPEALPS